MENSEEKWTDEMIEGLVEEEIVDLTLIVMETVEEKTIQNTLTYGYNLPDGYIFKDENGNVINATKIVLEKKKNEYPKTYEECAKLLNTYCGSIGGYNWKLLSYFQKLLICRDAYWKIAGDEMELGKPWEPDWKSLDPQYIILYQYGGIDKAETHGEGNYILTFPTAEMRDAFKENFDPDIKICKELL